MRSRFGVLARGWAIFVGPPLVALLIGVAVAVALTPPSLGRTPGRGLATGRVDASPSPADPSPIPSVTSPGVLGDGPHLTLGSPGILGGSGANLSEVTSDAGKTWTALRPPSGAAGIGLDPSDPRHAISGGASIQVTTDGSASWKPPRTRPPGAGPYQALQISPFDGNVWFLVHQQKLLRTRDASLTWRDVPGLPALAAPVMVPGTVLGQFFLALGNRVFELVDNGQQVVELPPLAQNATVVELAVAAGDPPSLLARLDGQAAFLLKGKVWTAAGGGLGGPVGASNGTLLVGNGGAKLGSRGAVSYSIDVGTTWLSAIGLPYDQSVEAIGAQANSSTVFAYCHGGDVYTSTDGGRAWTLLTMALRTTAG